MPGCCQPYRFTGNYQDPTSLYHPGARYHDPNVGRFNSPDPSGQEGNPHLYAEDGPVNRIDPSGLFSFSDFLDIGSRIVGDFAGCLAGIGAASETGVTMAATTLFGPAGTVGSVIVSCAVGVGAAELNADILSYG
ncbi:RHS repeat-associated core domain-containing protein [Streptomyces avermitilis]|uniref:RHS repeat-associated core domain-containing protein n=1 Tax=Streptomyces avermitilis TaxID=33903 RepID=UPI00277B58C5|nr:RHS repeat-associated core domain-containing protein [Streptomyces avermitilis]